MDDFAKGLIAVLLIFLGSICFITHRTMLRDERMATLGYCQVYIASSGAQWTKCEVAK